MITRIVVELLSVFPPSIVFSAEQQKWISDTDSVSQNRLDKKSS